MKKRLRVLIVEDSEFDTLIMVNELRKGGYAPIHRRVDTQEAMIAALAEQQWDVVLSDYNMPRFTMSGALELLQKSGQDLPFIIVSGGIGEDTAVAAMKAGAHDYLMKGNLARLVPAVERELRDAANRQAQRQAEINLRESELRYRLLWETSFDAVFLVDTEGTIHFANPAVQSTFGYKPDEVIGRNLTMLMPEDLRDRHRQGFQRIVNADEAVIRGSPRETVGRHEDGRNLPIEISFSKMEIHGQQWFVAFIRDISQRKKQEAELLRNQEQFRIAREIQQRLFPKAAPEIPGYEIAGASFPAEATGGDYFDFIPLQDKTMGIAVGDVTGHGLGPALLMAETRAYLRILGRNRSDLGDILRHANLVLAEDVSYERFVTLLLAKLDPIKKILTYASAGHPPGYVLDATGALKRQLRRTGGPLGIQPQAEYVTGPPLKLESGDIILLLTDGVEEAMSPSDEFFGIDRILDVVRPNAHLPAQEIVSVLYQAVRDFAQHTAQIDDVTAVIIKVK